MGPRKSSFFAIVALFGLLFLFSTQAMPGGFDNINGTICRAANLAQAQSLAWNHARVSNPGTTPLFVVCTFPNDAKIVWDGTSTNELWWKQAGGVAAWFDTTAAGTAEVACIWRDLEAAMTDNVAVASVAGTVVNPGGAPATDGVTFDLATAGFDPIYVNTQTVTCRLDPGTGINAIQALTSP